MEKYVVAIVAIATIIALVAYLFYRDEGMKNFVVKSKAKAQKYKKKDVILVKQPTIFWRLKSDIKKNYKKIVMKKKEFFIGSDESNDFVLDSEMAEGKHARIRHSMRGNRECFWLKSFASTNPTLLYDGDAGGWIPMAAKQEKELGPQEAFKIGEYLFQVVIPDYESGKPTVIKADGIAGANEHTINKKYHQEVYKELNVGNVETFDL